MYWPGCINLKNLNNGIDKILDLEKSGNTEGIWTNLHFFRQSNAVEVEILLALARLAL